MKKNKLLIILVIIVLVLILVPVILGLTGVVAFSRVDSVKTSQSSEMISSKDAVVIGIAQDVDFLDPHMVLGAGTRKVLFNVYEGLIKPDAEGNLNPALASDYEIKEAGEIYIFKIREGVTFHNGQTLTAKDVKYSLERAAFGDEEVVPHSSLSGIKSVEISADNEVTVTLNEGNTELLAEFSIAIVPENAADLNTVPVGTGPYQYVSREIQQAVNLERFDNYWGEAAHIKELTFRVISDANAIVTNILQGNIDIFSEMTVDQIAQLEGAEVYVEEGPMNLVQALYLNNAKAPLDNEDVRKALCYSLDKQQIFDMLAKGTGYPLGSSMYPNLKNYFMPELNDLYPKNIEKAKQLLADAGYPDGFSLTITVPSAYKPHMDTAQILIEQLAQIGVKAAIKPVEWEVWLSEVYAGRDFEATVIGVDASSLSADAMLSRFRSDAPDNFINFNSSEYDKNYDLAKASVSTDYKINYYKECETILANEAANVYIQDMVMYVAMRNGLKGYEFYPLYVTDAAKLYWE